MSKLLKKKKLEEDCNKATKRGWMKVVCPPPDNTRQLQLADLSPKGDIGLETERRPLEDKIKVKPEDIKHCQRQWATVSKRAAG